MGGSCGEELGQDVSSLSGRQGVLFRFPFYPVLIFSLRFRVRGAFGVDLGGPSSSLVMGKSKCVQDPALLRLPCSLGTWL